MTPNRRGVECAFRVVKGGAEGGLFSPRSGRLATMRAGDSARDLIQPPRLQIRHLQSLKVPDAARDEVWPGEERTIPDWQVASKAQAVLVEGRTADGRRITRAYQPREYVELRDPQIWMNTDDERRMRAWLAGDDEEAWR